MLEFLLPPGLLEAEPPYWFAVVRAADLPRGAKYHGPPRRAEPQAETRVIVLEPAGGGPEGGVFACRYDALLGYITDTWSATREAAVEGLTAEFGPDLGPWTPVPEGERDPETYVLTMVARGDFT